MMEDHEKLVHYTIIMMNVIMRIIDITKMIRTERNEMEMKMPV